MTKQQALTKIVGSLRKAELCLGCGELEERCACQPPLEHEVCRRCTIPDPLCEHCELIGNEPN